MRILILDDDVLFVKTLADSLRREKEIDLFVTETITAEQARAATRQASEPFDVFLIDQLLGQEPETINADDPFAPSPEASEQYEAHEFSLIRDMNGIEVMIDLRAMSPESDAIIFTAQDDPDVGLRAYELGAYRYLLKPFEKRELVWILKGLENHRRAQHERNWLHILSEIAEESQRAVTLPQIQQTLVQGTRRLGFERVRLWEFDEATNELVGACQAGNIGLETFKGFRMPRSEALYSQRALEQREPQFFKGRELGPGYLEKFFYAQGFHAPQGEWAYVPLWANNRLIGALMLDNADKPRTLRQDQRLLIGLLGRQAVAALERARFYEAEKQRTVELEALHRVGLHLTSSLKMPQTLEAILNDTLQLIQARDAHIFLYENGILEYASAAWAEAQAQVVHDKPRPNGLTYQVARSGQRIIIPDVNKDPLYADWQWGGAIVGLPLKISEQTRGVMTIAFTQPHCFSNQELRTLDALADQAAIAIENARLYENEERKRKELDENTRQSEFLHRVHTELMKLVEEQEDWLWHATLTAATANYGLKFNRALLLMVETAGPRLRGRLAIGHRDLEKAEHDWKHDEATNLGWDDYLRLLRANALKDTPVQKMIHNWTLGLNPQCGALWHICEQGNIANIRRSEIADRLPLAMIEQFGLATDCAIVPLRSGQQVEAIILVDNLLTDAPISEINLNHLAILSNQANLICTSYRSRRVREDLTSTIMAEVSGQTLLQTLKQIAHEVRVIARADFVAIYPLRPNVPQLEYDLDNLACDGEGVELDRNSTPSKTGVTAHVLNQGLLIVPDIQNDQRVFAGHPLREHHFLKRSRLGALIGMPIKDVNTDGSYGVMYIDYRRNQAFRSSEISQIEYFAKLTSAAIRNARATERALKDRDAAHLEEIRKERNQLRAALAITDAVGSLTELGDILRVVLKQLVIQFNDVTPCVLTYDEDERELVFERASLQIYTIDNPRHLGLKRVSVDGESIASEICRESLVSKTISQGNIGNTNNYPGYLALRRETQSEFCITLMSGEDLLGVLALESTKPESFDEDRIELIKSVAKQISIVLDRARQAEKLRFSNTIAATTAWAADIAHDVNTEVAHIRHLASALLSDQLADDHRQRIETIEKSAGLLESTVNIALREHQQSLQEVILDRELPGWAKEMTRTRSPVTLDFDLSAAVAVRAHPAILRRVIRHLIRNILDATYDPLIIKVRTHTIRDSWVEVQIEDDGPGIPIEIQHRLFQVPTTTKPEKGGYGLLFVRSAVESMGGTVRLVRSDPYQSTLFAIRIPPYKTKEAQDES